jgi:hypothetical protein
VARLVEPDYSAGELQPSARRNRVTAEQTRRGWEMTTRIEKILRVVLREAHEREVWSGWE